MLLDSEVVMKPTKGNGHGQERNHRPAPFCCELPVPDGQGFAAAMEAVNHLTSRCGAVVDDVDMVGGNLVFSMRIPMSSQQVSENN
jgi:hypothetical protein